MLLDREARSAADAGAAAPASETRRLRTT
jgi:hypothetical protein